MGDQPNASVLSEFHPHTDIRFPGDFYRSQYYAFGLGPGKEKSTPGRAGKGSTRPEKRRDTTIDLDEFFNNEASVA